MAEEEMAEEEMAWARFGRDHDWRAGGRTVAFKAGMRVLVTRACLEEAKRLGRAEEVPTPTAEAAERLRANPWFKDPPPPAEPPTAAPAA